MSTRASSNAQRSQSAQVHRYVNRQLDKTRRQVKSTELITHLLVVTIFVIGFLQLMALVDAWVWSFNSVARWLSFIFLVGATVGYLGFAICPLLLRKIHPDYAAKMIEEFQPTFKNSLLNYVSLRRQPKATHTAVMDAVTKQAAIDLQTVPEDATVDRSSIIRIGFYLLGLIAFVAFYWMLSPKDPLQSFSRILLPSAKAAAPSIVQVTDVSPGDQEIFFGEPVVVSATIKGQFSPEDVQLVYSTVDGQVVDQVLPMHPQTTSSSRYEATLTTEQGGVVRGLIYKVVARDGASPDYEIVVRPNPSIALTTAEITPPAYTLLPPETVSGQGAIEAVEGSLIKVNALANLPIKLAYIELLVKNPKDPNEFVVVESVSMTANEMEAHGEFHAIYNYQAQKQRATHFRLKFLSTEDDANQNANVHALRIIADLAPQIEVLNPIQNSVRLPVNDTLLIDVRATDTDYGISSIELEMQNNGTNVFRKTKLPLQSEDGKKRVRGQFQFTPKDHFLRAGETVLFTATASDNRTSYLSGALDPNQTITRQYQIEILDAVENPQRSADDDPSKGDENSQQNDPLEQGDQDESEGGESNESGDTGSSSGDDEGDPGESGDEGQSEDEGGSGAAGESGEEGGESGEAGGSESGGQEAGQQSGDQGGADDGGGGESASESDPQNGSQDAGGSQGDSAMNEGAGTENAETGGSESGAQQEGGSADTNQKAPSSTGSEENGSRGDNTQGDASQSPPTDSADSAEQGSGNQNAGSEGDSQGNDGQSAQQNGNDGDAGARKPLSDDAADGDVMSRMEEIMKEEKKSKDGSGTGEKSGGQDQQPAEQNTGRGTDPNQENPRQSEGTGSMQQDDQQPPQDAQGADNNAQRGDGKSSSSQGQQNGTAKGSSGNQTGDQSQEGASSDDSNTGQSDEAGGNDPGNAASDSSNENQQQSGKSGSGESGSAGQSSQEGAKPSKEAGEGSSGQQKPGGEKGGEQGGEGADGEGAAGEGAAGEGAAGEGAAGESAAGEGAAGEGAAGDGQSSGSQQASDAQSSSSSGKTGGSPGSGSGGETIAEKENIEHSKKATDMVLKRLEQERFDPDPELLKELNWSKEDLNQFLDRWQQMKSAAETGDPVARQRYDKALKSLGLSSDDRQAKVRGVSDKKEGFNTDSAVNRPPQEIAPGYRAFKRARNRSKN